MRVLSRNMMLKLQKKKKNERKKKWEIEFACVCGDMNLVW